MTTNAVCAGTHLSGDWYQPYQWYYVPYTYAPTPRPIRLSMKEVEQLRAAAKKDKALKAVLVKFTDQIEVVVDFEAAAA